MFKTIVVGHDGSIHGDRAMGMARLLASEQGARVVIVHVTELIGGKGGIVPMSIDEPDIRKQLAAEAEELREAGRSAEFVHRTVDVGGPAAVIAEVAREEHADLIVVGSRGHSAVAEIFLGSVSLRLLHIAHRPVLVIPPPVG